MTTGVNEVVREKHYLVKSADKKITSKGDAYWVLELTDKVEEIEAKIWSRSINQCQFEAGKIIEVNGKSEEYRGKISIIIDNCQIVNSENQEDFRPIVPTLVFDIETAGKSFEQLDKSEQEYLLDNLEKDNEDKEEAKKRTGLYSIFGWVVAIGCYDIEKNKGVVLTLAKEEFKPEKGNFEYRVCKSEKELLTAFWEMTKGYKRFVTYNGLSFDFPYLYIRSGINRIKTAFEIRRYDDNFIDLQEKIRQKHAFKLEFLCKAFGIENPKEEGVRGDEVSELFRQEEYKKIADYVARDVVATTELFRIWKEYMKGD